VSKPDPIAEYYKRQREAHAQRVRAQEELVASEPYQKEVKFINRITDDVIYVLQLCQHYRDLAPEYSDNSLVIQSTVDLAQSVLAAWELSRKGLINPIRRELRYIIESSVKHLYVDQLTYGQRPLMKLEDRLKYIETHLDSSLDARHKLELEGFHPEDAEQFVSELYDAYRACCAYVHVSRSQIDERLELAQKGRSLGFESPEEMETRR
jgi:hypothetical protein